MPIIILFGLIFTAALAWYIRKRLVASQQNKLFHQPLSVQWIELLANNVPLYSRLPAVLKYDLHGCVQLFLKEKEFIGRGIEISDQIRLTIACNACMLLINSRKRTFPGFTTILIYPDTYVVNQVSNDGFVEAVISSHRAGESWFHGPIVLSWGDVLRGSLNTKDGHNVVIHEFAHKLDEQNGSMDGLPVLRKHTHYAEWASVLSAEYVSLQERTKRGKHKVLDAYGTVSPTEFFAVATESFFEKSKQMKIKLPDLYQQLSTYYGVDPASW